MKKNKKGILLRVKAALAATAILVTLNACSNTEEVEEESKISGVFYLVPYHSHLYMITENHDVQGYPFRKVGYEGGCNDYSIVFYAYNGKKLTDSEHPDGVFTPGEVGFFHFENDAEVEQADEMIEEFDEENNTEQPLIGPFLEEANEKYLERVESAQVR